MAITSLGDVSQTQGMVSAFHAETNTKVLVYARYGSGPGEILLTVVRKKKGVPTETVALSYTADFERLASTPSLDFINNDATVEITNDDGTSYTVEIEPDPNVMGNAMFETSNGVSGTIVAIHNGWFGFIAAVVIAVVVIGLIIYAGYSIIKAVNGPKATKLNEVIDFTNDIKILPEGPLPDFSVRRQERQPHKAPVKRQR